MFGDSLADTTSHDASPPLRECSTPLCLPFESPTASVNVDAARPSESMILISGSSSSTDGSSRHESELLFAAVSTTSSTAAMVPKGHGTTKEGTAHQGNTQSGGGANVPAQLPKYIKIVSAHFACDHLII
jgi:hypothetical protein